MRPRRWLRDRFIRILMRGLDSPEVRHVLNRRERHRSDPRDDLDLLPDPYRPRILGGESLLTRRPIFITGRFRSGSTLVWNLFRHLDGFTAYYEPLNERRWFDHDRRGDSTDITHQGVSDYWHEYDGLDELARWYRERWIDEDLYMDADAFDYSLQRYIETLIYSTDNRAVLQFNRVDFRLPWLRRHFPEATLIHLYRDPREQWCSYLGGRSGYGPDALGANGYRDRFYLNLWARDLCRVFPFLSDLEHQHRYALFYAIWKMSYLFGRRFGHHSLSFEALVENPAPTLTDLLNVVDTPASVESLLPLIRKPRLDNWRDYASDDWFSAIETECESILRAYFRPNETPQHEQDFAAQ